MRLAGALLGAALFVPTAAIAADAPPSHAVGTDLFFSTDAEHTDVLKAGLNFDLRYTSPDKRLGVRLEKAWFKPLGEGWRGRERAYVRVADSLGQWTWNATVGSDGHTVLGAAGIHDEAPFRKSCSSSARYSKRHRA